jgi:hypothetical protein
MGMSVGSPDDDGEEQMNAAINTTPLVDVMLVLLIIFLITIPVVTQSITLQLPKERNVPTQTKPENIVLAVSKDGDIYWNTQDARHRERGGRAEEGGGQGAAARGAHPRTTRKRATRRGPPGGGLPARGHRQGRLHHRSRRRRGQRLRRSTMGMNVGNARR